MTVFKTFFKVVKAYRGTIIFYTILLIVFGGMNFQTNDNSMTFTNTKPDIAIVNKDSDNPITNNLIKYLKKNAKIIKLDDSESKRNDALFYRDVNYIIYIPKNYGKTISEGKKVELSIKKTPDYNAYFASMMLKRYLKVQNIYTKTNTDEREIIKNINNSLDNNTKVKVMSKLNTTELSNMNSYFNFASYSIMAIVIFIVCLVLSSFHEESIIKRTIISSMDYKRYNRLILISGIIYTIITWLVFTILGFFLLKETLFSLRGLIYLFNSLLFTMCSLTIALLISSLLNNKNAVNGIVNVIALGSSFLCGAFVPSSFLPKSVLNFSKILPTYWYINTNDTLAKLEIINLNSLRNVFSNMTVILIFISVFIILNNIITKYKRKIG